MAGHRLVDRVVDDLPDEVMQAALVGRADVHARAAADGLEALEDLDAGGGVVGPAAARLRLPAARSPLPAGGVFVSWSLPRSRGSSDQAVVELPQLLVAVVLDDDPAAAARSREADLRARARGGGPPRPARGRGPARRGSAAAGWLGRGSRRRRTSSSVWRTERSCSTTVPRTRSCCSTGRPPRARPWPSVIAPSATAAWTSDRGRAGEACSRRSSGPARPAAAICSWVKPNSSISRRKPCASSIGRGPRAGGSRRARARAAPGRRAGG